MRIPGKIRADLAVNLLIEGRPAVVIGGGKIGFRKTRLLLDAGAIVTVVAPELNPDIQALVELGTVIHLRRRFEPRDIEGAVVVFAATDDAAVNRQVLACAKEARILACAADVNWPEGDFLTPASVRRGGLQVAVSTGGRSCRQSRLVKDSLSRHLAALETMSLVVVGTSHEVLSANERERFHLTEVPRQRVGAMIRQLWGVHEFLILNTCNRIEVIAAAAPDEETISLLEKLLNLDQVDEIGHYRKIGPEAIEHLCLVTAGMRSQSVGETHITAQVKDAMEEAVANGWANGMLREWVDVALHVSKDIRAKVGPMLKGGEIEDVCLAYLEQAVPDLARQTVMVIGSGVVGRGLMEQCVRKGCRGIWCYHVNRPEVPSKWAAQVDVCTLNGIRDRLSDVTVVVSAVEAPGHVLHEGHAPFFDHEKNVLVIDLAMPRTVDPRLDGQVPGLQVVDLDGLKHWQRLTSGLLERVMDQSLCIVRNHHELYERIQESIQGGLPLKPVGVDPVG